MNLKNLSDETLLKKTRELAQEERSITTAILHHLREIESRKLFCDLGFSSLFDYCVRELGYSESSAQRRIASMRLMREIPEIEEKIENGKLSLSVISQAQTFFKQEALNCEEKREVLLVLEGKSTREAERELVSRSSQPEAMMPERVRPVSETHTELRFVADEKLMQDLEKIRGLLAHSRPNMTLAELVQEMANRTLEKIDPEKKRSQNALPAPAVAKQPRIGAHQEDSRYIPVAIRRAVWKRDQGKCTYPRCASRYALQIDHIEPYALGGKTELGNLRLLCRNHNQRAAIRFKLIRPRQVRQITHDLSH